LFTVDVSPTQQQYHTNNNIHTSATEVLQQSVYNMHSLEEAMALSTGEKKTLTTNTAEPALATAKAQKTTAAAAAPKKSAFTRTTKKSAFQKINSKQQQQQEEQKEPFDRTSPLTETAPSTSIETASTQPNPLQQQELSLEEQLDNILSIFLLQTKALKEGISTRQHVAGQADVLQDLDSISAQLIASIASASASATSQATAATLTIPFANKTFSLRCRRPVALPELRRHRSMYLKWAANHPPDNTSSEGIATSFLAYVEEHL
jgi:hypothetical protein